MVLGIEASQLNSTLPKQLHSLSPNHSQDNDVRRPEDAWIQIQYQVDMPPLTPKIFYEFYRNDYERRGGRTSLHEYLDTTARVKSVVWRQEHEWRILWRNDETRLKIHRVPVPENAMTAVYIGLAASASVEADVVFETRAKFPSAKIFKACKKLGYSELGFQQL